MIKTWPVGNDYADAEEEPIVELDTPTTTTTTTSILLLSPVLKPDNPEEK